MKHKGQGTSNKNSGPEHGPKIECQLEKLNIAKHQCQTFGSYDSKALTWNKVKGKCVTLMRYFEVQSALFQFSWDADTLAMHDGMFSGHALLQLNHFPNPTMGNGMPATRKCV